KYQTSTYRCLPWCALKNLTRGSKFVVHLDGSQLDEVLQLTHVTRPLRAGADDASLIHNIYLTTVKSNSKRQTFLAKSRKPAAEALQAAQANLRLARDLLKLAEDQRDAGVAAGIDVTRAATSVAQNTLALAQAQTVSEQARLRLQRITGLPLGGKLVLTDIWLTELAKVRGGEDNIAVIVARFAGEALFEDGEEVIAAGLNDLAKIA